MKRTAGKSLRTRRAMEQAIHLIFLLCGIVAVGFVLCISVYLVISGLPAIREIGLTKFLFGKVWAPTNATTGPQFGILPFLLTSVYGTAGALLLGVPVGLAVDGAASNDGSNLLEELRVCYLLHRLQSSQNAPTGYDILKLATRGSARLLGRDDIGCLAAGMAADCFLISLDRIELAGAQFDPLSLLGTVGLKGPVDYTIVNGMAVVQNGELVTADEGELAARANAAVCRYLGRC